MAQGITESDVHSAADALVDAGERPTIDRIRAYLGTGSPNTVTRWLETWWQGLGQRLQAQRARLAVPEAPDAVAELAGELWRLALESAHDSALDALTADRTALDEARAAFQAECDAFAVEAATLRDTVAAATHAEHVASSQATELRRLVSQLEDQLTELAQQREDALERAADADAARQAADGRLQALQDATQSERETMARHVQATEDRAHAEVDRARQESRELKGLLASLRKEQAAAEKVHLQAIEQSSAKALDAQREAEIQRAKAEALDAQLAQLRDLPAALQSVLQQAKPAPSPRKAAKRSARAPRGKKAPARTRKPSGTELD